MRLVDMKACCAVGLAAFVFTPAYAGADAISGGEVRTFAYATPADEDYLRALLEVSVVLGVGLLWYVTRGDAPDYDVNYQWPVFRRKLTGEALALDINHFGTNFIGHPVGGTSYYIMARGNRLPIPQAAAFTLGGSLVWEYFGEVAEIVSLNDMIVTPVSGIVIGEAFTQLGAFFDRSRPTLTNRVLGAAFAPIKSLNDWFDGAELARTEDVDDAGFPRNEWHRFDLQTGAAATARSGATDAQWRFSLASQLARLPGYDTAADTSAVFTDANLSNLELAGAIGSRGLADLQFASSIVLVGHYARHARLDPSGAVRGHGVLIGWSLGFEYAAHDYDPTGARDLDRIATVAPLGFMFEHRAALGVLHVRTRVEGQGNFGGVTPYAWRAYRRLDELDAAAFPPVLTDHGYYFAIGGQVAVAVAATVGSFEAEGKARFGSFEEVGTSAHLGDQRSLIAGRLSCGIPKTAARVALVVERRGRSGDVEQVHADQTELGVGLELGVRL